MTPQRTLDYGLFSITENSFGFQSYNKEGKPLIFSHSEQDCSYWTNRYLAAQQDGWSSEARTLNDGLVAGKL